jgi:hypothetical protein
MNLSRSGSNAAGIHDTKKYRLIYINFYLRQRQQQLKKE